MTDASGAGTPWRDDEVDTIIADYFVMLEAELAGRPYIKAQHNAAISELTGRSRGSVEFKYQNISAVLDELGMPTISGYKPRRNYQAAIFPAIDRYLSRDDAAFTGMAEAPRPWIRNHRCSCHPRR